MKQDTIQKQIKQRKRLSSDEWAEVGDLIDQCVQAADIDETYSRHVRDKAMAMMTKICYKAVDNGLSKKNKNP